MKEMTRNKPEVTFSRELYKLVNHFGIGMKSNVARCLGFKISEVWIFRLKKMLMLASNLKCKEILGQILNQMNHVYDLNMTHGNQFRIV